MTAQASRRRLALLHYTAPPVTGGVESVLAAHAILLRRAGHHVRVIAGRGEADLIPEVDSRHPDVERVAHLLAGGDSCAADFEALRGRLVERLRPLLVDRDAVIAHNVLTMPFNLPLAAALTDVDLPVIAWVHDLAWINPVYAAYRHTGWPWSILHRAQPGVRYVAVSHVRQRQVAETLEMSRRAISVVPNGIDPEAFWGLSSRTARLARRAGFACADPLILVPVRVTRRKRLELALRAAALLRADLPSLRLVVSGPLGPHSADNLEYAAELGAMRLKLGLDDVVSFLHELVGPAERHPIGDRTIAELYRMADLVLLPSESEGFGLPVLEAGLSRAPLVCADIPVLREVSGGAAWLFPSDGGAAAVARAVRSALASRTARLRSRAMRAYSWPVVMDRMQAVIEASCGG